MLRSRPFIVIGLIAVLSICLGCAATPVLDRTWGKSFEAKKSNQTMNPEAGKNLEPVVGLDGQVAEVVLGNYENLYKQQVKKRPLEFEFGETRSGTGK